MAKCPQRPRAFQTRKQQGQRLDEAHGRTVNTVGAASVPARVVRKADQTLVLIMRQELSPGGRYTIPHLILSMTCEMILVLFSFYTSSGKTEAQRG